MGYIDGVSDGARGRHGGGANDGSGGVRINVVASEKINQVVSHRGVHV